VGINNLSNLPWTGGYLRRGGCQQVGMGGLGLGVWHREEAYKFQFICQILGSRVRYTQRSVLSGSGVISLSLGFLIYNTDRVMYLLTWLLENKNEVTRSELQLWVLGIGFMMGVCSGKCVLSWCRHCANIMKCTYTSQDHHLHTVCC
jgi:hypothetical protein